MSQDTGISDAQAHESLSLKRYAIESTAQCLGTFEDWPPSEVRYVFLVVCLCSREVVGVELMGLGSRVPQLRGICTDSKNTTDVNPKPFQTMCPGHFTSNFLARSSPPASSNYHAYPSTAPYPGSPDHTTNAACHPPPCYRSSILDVFLI